MRCDFNVPLHEGRIADPARIDASLDTIRYILNTAAWRCSARTWDGPRNARPALSLKPVAEYLSTALGRKVALAPDCIGEVTLGWLRRLSRAARCCSRTCASILKKRPTIAIFPTNSRAAKMLYVNDAFGSAHRAHASTVGVTRFLAERAAGFLMMRELKALSALTHDPAHPYVAILGGAKVSDKIGVIRNLMAKVDAILIGGAMAYTFLRARGIEVGRSRVEADKLELAGQLMAEAAHRGVALMLPDRPRGRSRARRRHG